MRFSLGIENGTLISGSSRMSANLYVAAGRIACLARERLAAAETVDASGLFVLPGMVDAHVHFMDPGDPTREDFLSGTAAAVGAGVTCVVEHTHARPVRTPADLEEKVRHLASRARVDFGLAAHAWPGYPDDAVAAWSSGATFIKAFTCTTHGIPGFDSVSFKELLVGLSAAGATSLVHCEDEGLTAAAESELRTSGRDDGAVIPLWRSEPAEALAIEMVGVVAKTTGARVIIAHVSSRAALERVQRLRREGANIGAETCPQYLTLSEDEVVEYRGFRKFTPPARARNAEDLQKMVRAVADGSFTYVATDHAPATAQQKEAGSIWDVYFGLPGIDTTLPILLDFASRGDLTYERVVRCYAEAPTEVYGLAHRKGRLVAGADADLVLVDPNAEWTISNASVRSKAGWTPYAGRRVRGRVTRTYVRGNLGFADGEILASPGLGEFIAGPAARASSPS